MSARPKRMTVVLAPGGPGLGAETLAELPLPVDCECVFAVPVCDRGDDPIAQQTARLIELANTAASYGNVALIGHSAGAWSVIRAASQMSDRLAAVVLIAAQLHDVIDQPDLLDKRLCALGDSLSDQAYRAQNISANGLPLDDSVLLELMVADMALTMPTIGRAQQRFLDACRHSWNPQAIREHQARPIDNTLATLITQIRLPILVINGELDPWSGALSAHRIGIATRYCSVETIAGAGHAPWIDDPARIRMLLARAVSDARAK